jgi:hypothetical protein
MWVKVECEFAQVALVTRYSRRGFRSVRDAMLYATWFHIKYFRIVTRREIEESTSDPVPFHVYVFAE